MVGHEDPKGHIERDADGRLYLVVDKKTINEKTQPRTPKKAEGEKVPDAEEDPYVDKVEPVKENTTGKPSEKDLKSAKK